MGTDGLRWADGAQRCKQPAEWVRRDHDRASPLAQLSPTFPFSPRLSRGEGVWPGTSLLEDSVYENSCSGKTSTAGANLN